MLKILAFILAGGRVNELKTLTKYRPKSAVPFAGEYRIIDFPLSNLMHSRIGIVGVLSQYRSSPLINHILDGRSWDLWGRNRMVKLLPPFKGETGADWYNGTVDAVQQNLDFIHSVDPELVIIVSGDHIYKMDYRQIINYHINKNADVTIGFIPIDPAHSSRFGVAELDEEDGEIGGRVFSYSEKPKDKQSKWASLTIYVFNTRFLHRSLSLVGETSRQEGTVEFGRDLIARLVNDEKKSKIYGYKFYGYWGYTRTITEFWQSNMDVIHHPDKIDLEKWQIRTNLDHRGIRDRIPATVKAGSYVKNSLICHGSEIYGKVVNSVLSPGVIIKKGATVYNSIIMFDTVVGENAFLNNVILDVDVKVAPGIHIGNEGNLQPNPNELQVFGENERIN